jgi:hypothetical protein
MRIFRNMNDSIDKKLIEKDKEIRILKTINCP